MHTKINTPAYSSGFLELSNLFHTLDSPYSLGDIARFNLLYQRIYAQLNRIERHRAEELVDALIDGLENREWAAKIYGVV